LRIAKLMLGIVPLSQVLQDTATLEEADGLAICECVGESGDSAIGVDFKEPGFFLFVGSHVDFVDFVGEAVGCQR
jgi:hypothetical protein